MWNLCVIKARYLLVILWLVSATLSPTESAQLSTLFDVGGIAGAIVAGGISDYSGMSATTCAGMLSLAIPMVSCYSVVCITKQETAFVVPCDSMLWYLSLWDLRFSWWWRLQCCSSGLWCCVYCRQIIVMEEHSIVTWTCSCAFILSYTDSQVAELQSR